MVSQMINQPHSANAKSRTAGGKRIKARMLVLALCSSALTHGAAFAQAFNGTATVSPGTATVSGSGTTTTIDVLASEAVINWTVDNAGPSYEFQAAGTQAYFQGNGVGNYIVLNRILPTNGAADIEMNGAITSSVGSDRGGQIWFYSPGGFLIGGTANIDVGSLVLTSSDIDQTDGLLDNQGNIRFTGSPSTSSIVIAPGAQITAGAQDQTSYVALLAPRIEQSGAINVDGSAAFVAAEAATLRFNAGLFDVSVSTGSDDRNGIVHTGTTTVTGLNPAADVQRIAMVAVAKNNAMTMLLSGTMGYDPAETVGVDGSAIILSAGYDVADGLPSSAAGGAPVDIAITDATFTSSVGVNASEASQASGTITIGVAADYLSDNPDAASNPITLDGSVSFQGPTHLAAGTAINIVANAGQSISFAQDASLVATNESTGGEITLFAGPASGPILAGEITANALSLDVGASATFDGASATAGTISLTAQGGTISASSLDMFSSATAGDGTTGGRGQGGTVTLSATQGGTLDSGFTNINAEGRGGYGDERGGDGAGGAIDISADSASLSLGTLMIAASGIGGSSQTQGGDGYSGRASLAIANTDLTLNGLIISADAQSGEGFGPDAVGGSATGDSEAVEITVSNGGYLELAGDTAISADADGRQSSAGAQVQAGGITIDVSGGSTLYADTTLQATANAIVTPETGDVPPQFTPTARGGTILVRADGGTLEARAIDLQANAYGAGASQSAGSAVGGTVHLNVGSGYVNVFGDERDPAVSLEASAFGAAGLASSSGQGGTARLTLSGGEFNTGGTVSLDASGRFSSSSSNSDAAGLVTNTGGSAIVETVGPAGGTITVGAISLRAIGDGRLTDDADQSVTWASDGSHGVGGLASMVLNNGLIETSSISLSATGIGGDAQASDSATGFTAGSGQGGISRLNIRGATVGTSELLLEAQGFGGTDSGAMLGAPGAVTGGTGTGGDAAVTLSSGSLSVGAPIEILANGFGGGGGFGGDNDGGSGGAGIGGSAVLRSNGISTLSGEALFVEVRGVGGSGGTSFSGQSGNGGNAQGGNANVVLGDAGFSFGSVRTDASATSGDGWFVGDAAGGNVGFNITDAAFLGDPALADGMQREISNLTLIAGAGGGGGEGGGGEGGSGTFTGGTGSVIVVAGSQETAPVLIGSLSASLGTGLPSSSGQGFSLLTGNTAFTVGGSMDIETAGPISLMAGNGASIIVEGDLYAYTAGTITGLGALQVRGFGELVGDNGIALQVLGATTGATFSAANGAVSVASDLSVEGELNVDARSIAIRSLNGLQVGSLLASDGGITLTTGEGVSFAQEVNASGAITVSSGGAVTVQAPMRATSISLSGTDVSTVGDSPLSASNGDISITATNSAALGYTVEATGALIVNAGGAAQFGAQTVARDITVRAADIEIGDNAVLGSQDSTQSIALTFAGADQVSVGSSSSAAPGLSTDELGRISAQRSIDLFAGSPTQNILIEDLFIADNGGMLGTSGRFGITGYGRMIVSGTIDFTTASNQSTLALGASDLVLLSDTGSISLHDDADAPQGQLLMSAGRLFVGSNAALNAIDGLSSVSEIAEILDAPPEGDMRGDALIAGHIGATVSDALFIQNLGASDAFEDRQGFLANSFAITNGAGGTNGGAGPVAMSINGRILTPAGTFVTGFDVAAEIRQNGVPLGLDAGAYRPFSTVNGCVLGQTCGGNVSFTPPRETLVTETIIGPRPILEMQQPPITLGDMPLFEMAPLVDEPVTGVGNEDLWDADRP